MRFPNFYAVLWKCTESGDGFSESSAAPHAQHRLQGHQRVSAQRVDGRMERRNSFLSITRQNNQKSSG